MLFLFHADRHTHYKHQLSYLNTMPNALPNEFTCQLLREVRFVYVCVTNQPTNQRNNLTN